MYQAANVGQVQGGDSGAAEKRTGRYSPIVIIIGTILWLGAIAGMVSLALFIRSHPQPEAFELSTTRALQSLSIPGSIQAILRWFTAVNDPLPDAIIVPIVVVLLALIRKFVAAIFLALSVMVGNGVDALIGDYVGRPRPSVKLVHVDSLLKFNSFPSGHSCHMMVFWGFLLYLSLTKPVRQWKYRWALLPLQIFALFTILIMGVTRLWEGEHWVLDVVGGYLDGAIWMVLFIFLYHITYNRVRARRLKKETLQAA